MGPPKTQKSQFFAWYTDSIPQYRRAWVEGLPNALRKKPDFFVPDEHNVDELVIELKMSACRLNQCRSLGVHSTYLARCWSVGLDVAELVEGWVWNRLEGQVLLEEDMLAWRVDATVYVSKVIDYRV